MNFGRRSQDDLTLDVTPLIDVVFLLLIFFMVTTTFASRSGIGVKLPEAQAKERPPGHVVELTLTTKGELYLDKGKVATGGLAAALAAAAREHAGEVVVIRADAAVPTAGSSRRWTRHGPPASTSSPSPPAHRNRVQLRRV